MMKRVINTSARTPGQTAALGRHLTPGSEKGSSRGAPAAPGHSWAVQGMSPPSCSPGLPPTDAWLQSVCQPRLAIPTAPGASALALAPGPSEDVVFTPSHHIPLLLSAASSTWLPISPQMGSSGLWKYTGTGMLECQIWANTTDFG